MKKKMTVLVAALVCGLCAFADITISPSSIDYAVGGGGAAIKTSGSGSWTATSDADWITVVKSSGEAGVSCTYIVSRNNDADSREGHITISGNIYTVTQKGCPVELSPASATFGKTGGSGIITASVDAGVAWTASPSDKWITVTPVSGSGAAELSYTVAAYDAVGSRTGTIRIGSEKFTITQVGVEVTLSPVATNVTKDVCIVPLQVVALTETTWKVTPQVSWISVLDGGTGHGGSQVSLAVAENPSFEKRTGTVAIGSATFTVVQSGTDDVNFKILPEVATASPLGAFANVAVYATPDASWTAESMDSWIKITEGEEGAGNGNVKYVTMSNPELTSRTGHIKFTPPVYTPELDLYSGLTFWIKDQYNIEGNETRQTTYPLSKAFDGTFKNALTGSALPARESQDYTLSFSFKVGELNRINRLMTIKWHSIYLTENNKLYYNGLATTFVLDQANKWYTMVLRVAEDHRLTIYVGEQGAALSQVASYIITGFLTFTEDLPLSVFTFGYTENPSAGYLQSGQFANVRFWDRALTDIECKQVDTKQGVMLESEIAGSPVGSRYAYFPLNGNTHGTDGIVISPFRTNYTVRASGWDVVANRYGQKTRAYSSNGSGTLTFDRFSSVFNGSYSTSGVYSGYQVGRYNYPRPCQLTAGSDATYVFWVKIETLPAKFFYRELDPIPYERDRGNGSKERYIYEQILEDQIFAHHSCLSNGYFCIEATDRGAFRVTEKARRITNVDGPIWGSVVTKDEVISHAGAIDTGWHLLSFVGRGGKTIAIFVDGVEIANTTTTIPSFGYIHPLDARAAEPGALYGKIWPLSASLTVGGWNGSIDEMVFFDRALSAKENKELFLRGKAVTSVFHTVNQGIQQPTITPEYVAASKFGGTTNIALSVARTINWSATPNANWLSIVGATSGTGPANVMVKVAANPTCDPRIGTVTIGTKKLTVEQAALNCEIEADQTVFPTEAGETGGMGIISVSPEGNGSWTAESDVDWIYCYPESGTGSYDVYFFVEDMGSTAASRSGKITIGGKTIEITQRGYDLSIDPQICEVGGNAGAGVIGVAADAGAVWTAIADVPWITIVQTTDKFVHYTYTDNTTGETRIGHINISGEEYELRQTCKLDLNTTVVGKGTVTGGGKYAQGVTVSLKATPANGYEFSHWSGDVVGVESDTSVIMDTVKNVTATFIPEAAAQVLAEKKAAQGGFYTRDQIHNLELGNLVLDVDSATGKARIGVQLQETSDLSNPNWQPVEVTSGDIDLGKDGTVGIKAKATGNGMFYRVVVPKK